MLVLLVLTMVVGVTSGACSKKGAGRTGATVPTERTTTTTTIDVTKIPNAITVDYANAVMKSLDHVLGDAFRELVANKAPTADFDARLVALYSGKELEHQRSVYGQTAANGFPNTRTDHSGDPVTTVESILRDEPSCHLFRVDRDFAGFILDPKAVSTKGFIALAPKDLASDSRSLNPTPWSIRFDGDTRSHNPPPEPCV